jgi:hypothetical protein
MFRGQKVEDLKDDGLLEEKELVQLNAKLAMLHYGKDVDLDSVKAKYRALFKEKFDPNGLPVPYHVFRRHTLEVLDCMDRDPRGQELILEQFTNEAKSARAVFKVPSFQSSSDTTVCNDMVSAASSSVPSSFGRNDGGACQAPACFSLRSMLSNMVQAPRGTAAWGGA